MSVRRPSVRWAAPVAAVALIAAGSAVTASAGASTGLPAKTAKQLLVDLQKVRPMPLSGSVSESVNLGLPALSFGGAGPSSGLDPMALLSGTHTWRVWYADAKNARVALVDGSSETDVLRNATGAWEWSSSSNTATHVDLPSRAGSHSTERGGAPSLGSGTELSNPQAVAAWVLGRLDPTTLVTTTTTDTVAGRAAYGLVLTPRTSTTLVGSVHLSIDAATSLPLAVQVYARGSSAAAVDVHFTSLDLGKPAAEVFRFTPPPGATVKTQTLPAFSKPATTTTGSVTPAKVIGTGWSAVVVGTMPTTTSTKSSSLALLTRFLPTVSGHWGSGHLLTTALVTAVITNDGRYAVGSVDPAALYAALG